MFRPGGQPHPSFLNVEKRVSRLALGVDVLFVPIARDFAAQACSGGEATNVRRHLVHVFHRSLQSGGSVPPIYDFPADFTDFPCASCDHCMALLACSIDPKST